MYPHSELQIARFLSLETAETDYFLALVDEARAGTKDLKDHVRRKLDQLQDQHLQIHERVGAAARVLSAEAQSIYYSQWYYSAIHILITIPEYRTLDRIAAAFPLQRETIENVVLFLISMGLAEEKRGTLMPGSTQLHLQRDALNIAKHHTNWRLAAIHAVTEPRASNVHYSTVSSLSRDDFNILRARFVDQIQNYVETIQPSKEEMLCVFNLDLFELIRS